MTPDIEITGEAADGHEAVTAVERDAPDVVLMDLRMPIMDGVAATHRITEKHVTTRVLVLTTLTTEADALAALSNGASGFLFKDTPPEQVLTAIKGTHAGVPQLSPQVTRQLIDRAVSQSRSEAHGKGARELTTQLTDRELEIAIAIGQGRTNTEIAKSMYLSVATVKGHVTSLLTKLGVENRVQVAVRMHEAGLT